MVKKKINILIFANDEKMKRKALQMIDTIPCLVRIINSFQELSSEYSVRFIVFCHFDEIEMIEDEMIRWIENTITISYVSTDIKSMTSSILYNFIHSSLFQTTTNLFYITSLHFPLVDITMIKSFLDSYINKPILMYGEFTDKKISYWKQYFPSIKEKENKLVEIEWNKDNEKKFLYSCIMSERDFCDLYNISSPILYYHCVLWNTFRIPNYLLHYEATPFVKENDLPFIEGKCIRKRNTDLSLFLQKLWTKWKSIEERLE